MTSSVTNFRITPPDLVQLLLYCIHYSLLSMCVINLWCKTQLMSFHILMHTYTHAHIHTCTHAHIHTCRRGDQVILNHSAGHILRTKPSFQDEGGVAVGVASLDSPSLLPADEFIRKVAAKH